MNGKPHWGGPVKFIDTTRATPRMVLNKNEKFAIMKELGYKIDEQDVDILFSFLRDREIVDISFE